MPAYLIVPVVLSLMGSMTTPFSTHLDISKTAKDIAQEMNTDASARCMPEIEDVRYHLYKERLTRYLGRCCKGTANEVSRSRGCRGKHGQTVCQIQNIIRGGRVQVSSLLRQ